MEYRHDLFLMSQVYATLFTVTNKLQTKGDQSIEHVTSRQYMAMLAIAHLPQGETTLIKISRKLGTTKQSVKHLITAIENRGYVISVPSEQDKRAVNIILTEAGNRVLMDSSERLIRFFSEVFEDFTAGELAGLWSQLKKLYSYDGEEQDGFEADIDNRLDGELTQSQKLAVEEFDSSRRRVEHGN